MKSSRSPDRPDSAAATPQQRRAKLLTLVFTDMVGSTKLKQELGDVQAELLMREHHGLVRRLLAEYPEGSEISTAGDGFFLAFTRASDAVRFALQMQARLREWNRHSRWTLRDRIGIHVGEVLIETHEGSDRVKDLIGIQVDTAARVMSLGEANHILLTRFAFDTAQSILKGQAIPGAGQLHWVRHGWYELKGVAEALEICEVAESGMTTLQPPPDSDKARRVEEPTVEVAPDRPPTLLGRWIVEPAVKRKMAWAAAVVTAFVGLLTWVALPPVSSLSYDLGYLVRPEARRDEAVVVWMDAASSTHLRQDSEDRWDRALHAQLIRKLAGYGARGVVFDIWFASGSLTNAADRELVSAARDYRRVAVGASVAYELRDGVATRRLLAPFPELRDVVRWGVVPSADANLAIRKVSAGVPEVGGLAQEVARMIDPGLSVRPGVAWLNYYGPAETLPTVRYQDVLEGLQPATRFADKVVFVGRGVDPDFKGGLGRDNYRTPYTRWTGRFTPGVEIVATSYLNLVRNEFLRRLRWEWEGSLILLLGLVSGYGACRFRPVPALAIGVVLAGLALVVGLGLPWWTGYWFPWLIPAVVQSVCAGGLSVLSYTQFAHEIFTARARRLASRSTTPVVATKPERRTPATASLRTVSDARTAPPPIADHTLLREIGRGAYGEVWLARDVIGSFHAVKLVFRRSFPEPGPYEREFRGIQHFTPLSRLHPGLMQILHVGRNEEAGYFYYIMEAGDDERSGQEIDPEAYAPRNLESDLRRRGRLNVTETVALGVALAEALQFLHDRRLIHRDIKPSNIIYVGGRPKLADIGLVTEMADTTREVTFLGTKGYMAPEGPGTAAADVFSLGKVLYVAGMGQPAAAFPELPAELAGTAADEPLLRLNQVLLRACDNHADARLQTAAELREALRAVEVRPPG